MITTIKAFTKKILLSYDLLPKFKTISVGKYKLKADMDCRLDGYLANFKNYSKNFAELAHVVLLDSSNDLIVDIGANIGDTVALIRSENIENPIICIEGNILYYNLLKENTQQFENIETVNVFLSNDDKGYTGNLITHDGTAKIVKSENNFVETTSLNNLFKNNERNKVKILKTDTDGFDILILEGASEIISRDLPVIFFEYDPALNIAGQTCLAYLISLLNYGYSKVMFFDNFGNFLVAADLSNHKLLYQLDKYINGGAFRYYDVAVFNREDNMRFESAINFFENK